MPTERFHRRTDHYSNGVSSDESRLGTRIRTILRLRSTESGRRFGIDSQSRQIIDERFAKQTQRQLNLDETSDALTFDEDPSS